MERKNLQMGTRSQGGNEQKFRQRPDPITYGQKFGRKCQKTLNKKKNGNGLLKSRSSTLLESCEEFITSILTTWSSRPP